MTNQTTKLLSLALSLVLAACGGGDDAPPADDQPSCANLSGTWTIGGECGADQCQITQSGCTITQVNCTSGSMSTSGTIDGDDFSYTGENGGGLPGTCSGTANGNSISGTCDGPGTTCSFNGNRQ